LLRPFVRLHQRDNAAAGGREFTLAKGHPVRLQRIFAALLAAALPACSAASRSPEQASSKAEPTTAKPHAALAASSVTLFVLHEFWTGDAIASVEGSGSGFVVEVEGKPMIVTAAHVVEGATEIELFHASGFRASVKSIAAIDREADLALLEAAELPPAAVPAVLGEQTPHLADEVVLVSSPLGLDATLSFGTISAFRPELRAFQLAAGVSPGSSGGLVANRRGQVVGIIRAKAPISVGGENITLVTPAHDLVSLFERREEAPLLAHPDPTQMAAVRRQSVTTTDDSPFEDRKAAAKVELPPFETSTHYCATVDDPAVTVALGEAQRPVSTVLWRVARGRSCATIGAGNPLAVWVGADASGETVAVTVERQK
jgi:S1-C subfamily serine protease